MKAKKFVKQARKLMEHKLFAKYVGGDVRRHSDKQVLLNLQVCITEYLKLEKARREVLPDEPTMRLVREKADKTSKSGDHTVSLPKGYVMFHTPEVAGTNCNTWDLMRRGHHIGILREDRDGTFSEAHDKLEMGHDCIASLQDAVDCLIDNHEEYISRKASRAHSNALVGRG